MANVQKENGYTPIAHPILEALARHVISPDEWRILMVIFRKTYGWSRKEDSISLSQFSEMTEIPRNHISRVISKLISRNIIYRVAPIQGTYGPHSGANDKSIYGFQKDFDRWGGWPLNRGMAPKQDKGGPHLGQRVAPKQGHTKEKEKENIKEIKILSGKRPDPIPFKEIISYLNGKTGKKFSDQIKSTRSRIRARWNEGKRLPDFEKVVNIKCAKWLTDDEMVDYLRPETLFGTKMESYLNEKEENHAGDPVERIKRARLEDERRRAAAGPSGKTVDRNGV